jgi:hypothetical protein
MNHIKYTATTQEGETIAAIAARYWDICAQQNRDPIASRMTIAMDIEGAHCNGCPLQLDGLLQASTGDFLHDVLGIVRHIDRKTGRLDGIFCPRYAAQA